MDGNNRWSLKNKKSSFDSYKHGAEKLIKISNYLFQNHAIKYISAFALSTHNLKRNKTKLKIIFQVFDYFLNNMKSENHIFKIRFIGNKSIFDKSLIIKMNKIEKINSESKKLLSIFINYSGTSDILHTIKKINSKNIKNINLINFKNNLYTDFLPEPEILLRTGGFQRISDFMLFDLAFTEFFFLKKLWPDLNNNDLKKVIERYKVTKRKFGC